MNLIIDVGNTRIKAAVFENDSLLEQVAFKANELVYQIEKLIASYPISRGIVSSVTVVDQQILKELRQLLPLMELNGTTKLPFKNRYTTPKTLGADRIALVAAAVDKFNNKNVLIIDAGTCITFDFVSADKNYEGGAISLGIQMRYVALNSYTSKLPLLEMKPVSYLIGNSTETSIHSGVVNGVLNEIEGVIKQYKSEKGDLTVVLTGGDTIFLAKQLKSSIFANPNFVLEGLNTILIYNKEEC